MYKLHDTPKPEFGTVLCPDCFGDGIETCHNPDHGFLIVIGAIKSSANESACPCCGHNENHKMNGECYTCKGMGVVSKDEYDSYLNEFVPEDSRDYVGEYCVGSIQN